ncbi:SAM-dependent methyltransferase [Legionella busanensis]|uniref:SAM-dependent methyltransferase n=1 Tax=Legionella busanensis TaxID=190655 RepID=A0A378K9F2_9GAMM|nr:class I SAM-dependent methyltransferase [Legionella busanensis]STX81336.1 SAM-dependent methyltransferase [Legionella busanensis]
MQPREALTKAIEYFNYKNKLDYVPFAIDLGCGTGTDALKLLDFGWSVLAIDANVEAITILNARCPLLLRNKLFTKIASFETLNILPLASLISANYSLHFLKPDIFYKFWNLILTALPLGGIFAGTILGVGDSWNKINKFNMTFCKKNDLKYLLKQLDILWFEETKRDGADALGYDKFWHTYTIVAKKK